MIVHQTINKVESRYVMESALLASEDKSSGSGMELWSAESELSYWPTARQLERKFLNVACRAVVLNESIYQRVASTNVTTASALTVQLQQQVQQRSRSSIPSDRSSSSSSSGQVSASMASSHHSRDSYSLSAASKGIIYTSVRPSVRPFGEEKNSLIDDSTDVVKRISHSRLSGFHGRPAEKKEKREIFLVD